MAWTPEEQKEHRKLWVEALRSGKYQRTTGKLRNFDGTGFCCLGVACEISALGEWDGLSYRTQPEGSKFGVLSKPVADWLGLASLNGQKADLVPLSELNDTGTTFTEIADIIEAEPDGLIAPAGAL